MGIDRMFALPGSIWYCNRYGCHIDFKMLFVERRTKQRGSRSRKWETSIQPHGSEKSISHMPMLSLFSLIRACVCSMRDPRRSWYGSAGVTYRLYYSTATYIRAVLILRWIKNEGEKYLAWTRRSVHCYIILCFSSSLRCK